MTTATDDTTAPPREERERVWRMFDRIAPRYDCLNRVLSFRRDIAWRKRMARFLAGRRNLRLLDLATGTGDQIFHFMAGGADIGAAEGLDMAEAMLAVGREKAQRRGLDAQIVLRKGDATAIPGAADRFDAVSITFGIRNVGDVAGALREMRRVLVPGGRALVLEFSLPANRVFRALYLFYLRHLLPHVGGALSGDTAAYRYLNRTIETFPHGEAFRALMRDAGFVDVTANPLTLGIATIYTGDKPAGG